MADPGRLCVERALNSLMAPVGASLLAMDVNDDAFILDKSVVFTFIASKLAPTGAVKKKWRSAGIAIFYAP
jgi:hypothetical protein